MAPERRTHNGSGWLYNPNFNPDWKKRKLYGLATWTNGMAFREFEFSEVGRPIIKIAEIKSGISGQTKFTEREYHRSYLIRAGDMLFCWSGQPQTSIDVFWWRGVDGWLNQHIFKVEPGPDVDRLFFFYVLKYLRPFFIAIARNKQTTGLGHVTKVDLERIEVGLPSKPEQRAIAEILGALDDKIELNRRMNQTLEAMARAIFKSWFVDFEPVRAKIDGRWRRGQSLPGLPANLHDLFPDSFEDSDLGKIPRGWRIAPIGETVDVVGGSTPRTEESSFWDDGVHCFATPKDLSQLDGPILFATERKITDSGLAQIGSGLLPVGTVLLSSRAPIGYTAIAETPVAVNQGIAAVLCGDTVPNYYAYFWIKENLDVILSHANGSTFLEISKGNLRRIGMLVPQDPTLRRFGDLVAPLFRRLADNLTESRTLAAIRDALLPKLISGELRCPLRPCVSIR
jgi:type I restriction enzyme S subunit